MAASSPGFGFGGQNRGPQAFAAAGANGPQAFSGAFAGGIRNFLG